jgi:hypothetical protein
MATRREGAPPAPRPHTAARTTGAAVTITTPSDADALVNLRGRSMLPATGARTMNVIAILAVRNEELFLDRCLRHLSQQGVQAYLIDNQSDDGTARIARAWQGRGVIGIETFPFDGTYPWTAILQRKSELHRELGGDWYLHYDPDEIRQSFVPGQTLHDAIAAADAAGYNAIDFLEFDFLPTRRDERFENTDYVAAMRWYYHFRRGDLQHVKCWKNFGQTIDLASSGGHRVQFDGQRVSPDKLALRHYIVLSYEHAVRKYCQRVFDAREVKEKGWHRGRANLQPQQITLPDPAQLKHLGPDDQFDTSDPRSEHLLFGSNWKSQKQAAPAAAPPPSTPPSPPANRGGGWRRRLLEFALLRRLGH